MYENVKNGRIKKRDNRAYTFVTPNEVLFEFYLNSITVTFSLGMEGGMLYFTQPTTLTAVMVSAQVIESMEVPPVQDTKVVVPLLRTADPPLS